MLTRVKKTTRMKWTIETENGVETIDARLLGAHSSEKPRHNHPTTDYVMNGERCAACRWFEVKIFDTRELEDDDPEYLVYTCGHTVIPGEKNRPNVNTTNSPREIFEILTIRQGAVPKLPYSSGRALAQAADQDPDILDAYENRVVA